MNKSRLLALEQKFIVRDDPVEDGPEETVNLFFSADQPRLDDVINSVNIAIEQFSHYAYVKDLLSQSKEVSPHTFSFLKKEIIKSNSYLGFTDSVNIANESYHYTNSKTLALEGIGEFLKKIWNSIVNGFKWIVNKFKNLFGFGETNKNNIRELEKQMEITNREIANIIRDFPDMDTSGLQEYHSILISEKCHKDKEGMFNAYRRLQQFVYFTNRSHGVSNIDQVFEISKKEMELMLMNLVKLMGVTSATGVFLKALDVSKLTETLKDKPISEFETYQHYLSGLKIDKDTLNGTMGIIPYDKSNVKLNPFLAIPHSPEPKFCLPLLASPDPSFISISHLQLEDKQNKLHDLIPLVQYHGLDLTKIPDDSKRTTVNIVSPNRLIELQKSFFTSYAQWSKIASDLKTSIEDLNRLASGLEKLDPAYVATKQEFVSIMANLLKSTSSFTNVIVKINDVKDSNMAALKQLTEDYAGLCLRIYNDIGTQPNKENFLVSK